MTALRFGGSSRRRVAVFSVSNDLHALAVQGALAERDVDCSIVETNNLVHRGGIRWGTQDDPGYGGASLLGSDGRWIAVGDLDLVWWRRANQPQLNHPSLQGDAEIALVNNDWNSAVYGVMHGGGFRGRWLNHPVPNHLAENKILQLEAAVEVGLNVPRTLISQDPAAIRRFFDQVGGDLVMKPVRGTGRRALATVVADPRIFEDDDALRLSPVIYQERIRGRHHLRICCFGERVIATSIESDELDWRRNLAVPFRPSPVDPELAARCTLLLERLGLRMGIMDAKLAEDGTPYWLEVNPQGQFLFAQALGGQDLLTAFADFVCAEMREPRAAAGLAAAARPASAGAAPAGA